MEDDSMKKKLFLTVFLILIVFLMSGCGADLKVNTVVNPNLSGERIFTITVSEDDLNTINLTPDTFKQILLQNEPVKMDIKMQNTDIGIVYTLTEKFSNVNQLLSDSEKILGYKPNIQLKSKNDMLVCNYYFSDQTPAKDYFAWIIQALNKNNIGQDQKDNFINSDASTVELPGVIYYNNGTEYNSVENFPANQEAWITWNEYTKKGQLEVHVNIAPTTYDAFKSMNVDFKKSLTKVFNNPVSEERLNDGGMSYIIKIPISGDINNLTKTPLFANGSLTIVPDKNFSLKAIDKIIVKGNPTAYLRTSDIDSMTTFIFPKGTIIKNASCSTKPYIANSDIQILDNQVTIHLGEQTSMNTSVEIKHNNMYYILLMALIVILIVTGIAIGLVKKNAKKNN
jgi:hypothetical protein